MLRLHRADRGGREGRGSALHAQPTCSFTGEHQRLHVLGEKTARGAPEEGTAEADDQRSVLCE